MTSIQFVIQKHFFGENELNSIFQPWFHKQELIAQSIVLSCIRGPDGVDRNHIAKRIVNWYRRCVLKPVDGSDAVLIPYDNTEGVSGSYMGPSINIPSEGDWHLTMNKVGRQYLESVDSLPFHFHSHLIHCSQILGYKHDDDDVRQWWNEFYILCANKLHLKAESEVKMDTRFQERSKNS